MLIKHIILTISNASNADFTYVRYIFSVNLSEEIDDDSDPDGLLMIVVVRLV